MAIDTECNALTRGIQASEGLVKRAVTERVVTFNENDCYDEQHLEARETPGGLFHLILLHGDSQ